MANIILRLSTGSTSVSTSAGPNSSIGGKMGTDSAAEISVSNTTANNLFDNISKLENSASTTDYRMIYVHNDTATSGEIFASGVIFLAGQPKATIKIGVGAKNSEAQAVLATENAVPSGITFDTYAEAAPLDLLASGDVLNPGDFVPVWIERQADNITGVGNVTDMISFVVRGVE